MKRRGNFGILASGAQALPEGGFTLKAAGGHAGVDPGLDAALLKKVVGNIEAHVEAGMEFGACPLRGE